MEDPSDRPIFDPGNNSFHISTLLILYNYNIWNLTKVVFYYYLTQLYTIVIFSIVNIHKFQVYYCNLSLDTITTYNQFSNNVYRTYPH